INADWDSDPESTESCHYRALINCLRAFSEREKALWTGGKCPGEKIPGNTRAGRSSAVVSPELAHHDGQFVLSHLLRISTGR
ncbi:MAG: hypothetical protein V5A40_17440, partial [Haloarculaceae archaeon]